MTAKRGARRGKLLKKSVGVVCLVLLVGCTAAYGADTVETYDQNAADFEFSMGIDGLNLDKYEKAVCGSVLVGYGLLPRFSGYVSLSAAADEYLTYGESGYSFGLFGTPVDTDHFDLDLMLDIGMGGEAMGEMGVTPAIELNFDLLPDLGRWGLYARLEDSIAGRDESTPDDPATNADEAEKKYEINHGLNQTYGTYVTIAERHQLLAEYYHLSNTNEAEGELASDIGGFALGYNVMLTDDFELTSQVSYHPSHDDQDEIWGAAVGIIVAIPGAPPVAGE